MSTVVALFFASVLAITSAAAAEISVSPLGQNLSIVGIRGEITSGDAARFDEVIGKLERVTVLLQSSGGLISEALKIGARIRVRNFSTMVAPDAGCYSACGIIWLSGVRRYMSPTSRIGFHAAYKEHKGEYLESGVANAEIGSFLAHLGLRIEAIRFVTVAGPKDMLLLTPVRARRLGIEVFLLENGKVVTPYDSPTADTYAQRWISYVFLRTQCRAYLQPDPVILARSLKNASDKGSQLVGAKQFAELWTRMIDELVDDATAKGVAPKCIAVEAELRRQGQPTGIDGPSFDCTKASTPTEFAMCADADLWAKDRAMNAIYKWIRDNMEPKVRKRILGVQREWLAVRNACGVNRQCLNRVYDQRLEEMKMFRVPS